ncbi:hypothetical protein V1634_04505 [Plantactinospora veratri]|uniref:Secreted protein n=1 Tax=Plantactinospora veratri TaxID=1436122 RepID=A0ABU7S815_9ACTN
MWSGRLSTAILVAVGTVGVLAPVVPADMPTGHHGHGPDHRDHRPTYIGVPTSSLRATPTPYPVGPDGTLVAVADIDRFPHAPTWKHRRADPFTQRVTEEDRRDRCTVHLRSPG